MDVQNSTSQLFPARPLLEERLGRKRFDGIPASPGVYRFYDCEGMLLYVGKAKNLRRRLFSYKRSKAGRVSRKVARLISRIHEVVWVETESEREALLLENRMIRGDRPPFNHANKEPETYYYVYLKPEKEGLEFRLTMKIHDETEKENWYGCFKGHSMVRQSFGSLLRLLWMAEHGVKNPMHLPVQLTRNLTPMRFTMPWWTGDSDSGDISLMHMLGDWMKGESCDILDWFVVKIECGNRLTQFQKRYLETHLECLKTFYDKKLVRHRKLRKGRKLIAQEEFDDLLVQY